MLINTSPDVVIKHAFGATAHLVKMKNSLWISSRGMQIQGFDADNMSLQEMQQYLSKFYNDYVHLRTNVIPTDPNLIEEKHLKSLLEGYCQILKATPEVQDYWVAVWIDETNIRLDSKELKL